MGWPARGVSYVRKVVGILAGAAGINQPSFPSPDPSLPAAGWTCLTCSAKGTEEAADELSDPEPWFRSVKQGPGTAVRQILVSWLSTLLFSLGLWAVPVTNKMSVGLAELVLMVLWSKIVQLAWNNTSINLLADQRLWVSSSYLPNKRITKVAFC